MSKTWKWIIGILIGLLVLAVIVAIPFGMHQFASGNTVQLPARGFERGFDRDFGPGMMGRGAGNYYWHQGMMNQGYGYPSTMAYGFGFFAFGIFRLIIPLAVLGLAIYGVIALFKRRPASTVPAEAAPAAPARSCSNCGKPAQDDWKTCPYCGNSL